MATKQAYPLDRPWVARRKRDGIEYYLGHYPTKAEAQEVEANFDKTWPPYLNRRRIGYAF